MTGLEEMIKREEQEMGKLHRKDSRDRLKEAAIGFGIADIKLQQCQASDDDDLIEEHVKTHEILRHICRGLAREFT